MKTMKNNENYETMKLSFYSCLVVFTVIFVNSNSFKKKFNAHLWKNKNIALLLLKHPFIYFR